jgi:surfeit locus 1 family protein
MSERVLRLRASQWGFIALMLTLMGLFITLGTWQLNRLAEKEQLIATVSARFNAPPVAFPVTADPAALADFDYRPVSLTGRYEAGKTVLVFTSLDEPKGKASGPGYWVMTPFTLSSGGMVFINRGFIPEAVKADFGPDAAVPATQQLTGIARMAEAVGSFTPAPDRSGHIEWVRNPPRLAALSGIDPSAVRPLYVDLAANPDGGVPQGGETTLDFPNNHLGYLLTWYGFAALIPPLLWLWVRRQRRPGSPAADPL